MRIYDTTRGVVFLLYTYTEIIVNEAAPPTTLGTEEWGGFG